MNLNEQTEFTWDQQFVLYDCVIFVPVLEIMDLLYHDPGEKSDYSEKRAYYQTNRSLWFPTVPANSCVFYDNIPFPSAPCAPQLSVPFSAKCREWWQRQQKRHRCTSVSTAPRLQPPTGALCGGKAHGKDQLREGHAWPDTHEGLLTYCIAVGRVSDLSCGGPWGPRIDQKWMIDNTP